MGLSYNPSSSSITGIEYVMPTADDPAFQCGNNQAHSTSHDNPDNGTKAQRQADCLKLSPKATTVAAS